MTQPSDEVVERATLAMLRHAGFTDADIEALKAQSPVSSMPHWFHWEASARAAITEAIAATREADAMIAFRYAEGSANPQTKYVAAMVGEAIRKARNR